VTGTPIQNRLTDLASLFKFLQVYPYSNPQVFDKEISQPWHRNDRTGCLRVKTSVNFVTLYRTRAVINLPKRRDEVYHLGFTPEESEVYQNIKLRTAQVVTDAISSKERANYMNALSWLNQLRLVCNHGVMQGKKPLIQFEKGPWTSIRAQMIIEEMLDNRNAIYSLCDTSVAEVMAEDLDTKSTEISESVLFGCLQLICGSCLNEGINFDSCPTCSQEQRCVGFRVILTPVSPPQTPGPNSLPEMSPTEIPTKIKALLTALNSAESSEKR